MARKRILLRAFPVCLLLLALAACGVTREQSIARMNSFLGQPETAVIEAWGVPDKSYQLDAKTKIIAYREVTEYYDAPSSMACMGSYPGAFGYSFCGGGGQRQRKMTCEYSFHITGGVVADWSQHGNNCPAKN